MKFRSFDEFWPHYVADHQDPLNRKLHLFGTLCAALVLAVAIGSGSPGVALLAVVAGYVPAWLGHFAIEHNRPTTLRNPLYSLRGDLRMVRLMLRGQMDAELERLAGTPEPSAGPPKRMAAK